jgi:hypothetical protein
MKEGGMTSEKGFESKHYTSGAYQERAREEGRLLSM